MHAYIPIIIIHMQSFQVNCTIIIIIMHVDCLYIIEVFPPSNITLLEINTDQLTFTWNSIYANLSDVQYFVSTSNCGMCPNTTYSTSLRCDFINITSNLHECFLTILTMVCGRIGSGSNLFIVTIKGQLLNNK